MLYAIEYKAANFRRDWAAGVAQQQSLQPLSPSPLQHGSTAAQRALQPAARRPDTGQWSLQLILILSSRGCGLADREKQALPGWGQGQALGMGVRGRASREGFGVALGLGFEKQPLPAARW